MSHICDFVFVCVIGGWRSHDEDSAYTRFHTQTAARKEKTSRFGAREHHVRVSSVSVKSSEMVF